MSYRGSSSQHTSQREDRPAFGSAAGLVRWHFGRGAEAMGGLKAIDYDRDTGGARDPWKMGDTHRLFAFTTLALAVLDARQVALLRLAFTGPRGGLSDAMIAEREHCSETAIRSRRNRALRLVGEKAMAMALIPERR
jgi:hypothetical protein